MIGVLAAIGSEHATMLSSEVSEFLDHKTPRVERSNKFHGREF
jgi:hypothetical protein